MAKLDAVRVDITSKDIQKALDRPSDFGYGGDNAEMFVTWSLGPVTLTRDSRLLETANHKALIKYLESDPSLADDWTITGCNHWAVGWVEHLSFRAIEKDGTPTRMFRVLTEWFNGLSDYPVADEDLYSELEMNATYDWLSQEGPRMANRHDYTLPDDWYEKVVDYWDMNDSSALESRDDQGACPSDKQWLEAFQACEFAQESGE